MNADDFLPRSIADGVQSEADLEKIRERIRWSRAHTPAEIVERQKRERREQAVRAAERWLS